MNDTSSSIHEVPPVFLFGHDRSGTTLLSMIVGSNPLLAVPLSTTGTWYDFARTLEAYDNLQSREGVERAVDALIASERIRLWDEKITREEVLENLPVGDYPAIVRRFHECYARHKGKPYWGNIDISTLDHMDEAAQWFPHARFVHIVRDARDVALSNQETPFGVGNIAECAEKWRNRLYANLKMGSILGSDRYLVIRYEELVTDTETVLRGLCQFIGVPYSSEMLNYTDVVETKIPANRRFLWPELDKKPLSSKAYRWKTEMTENQRVVVETWAGDVLKRLGYETYDCLPKRAGAYALDLWYYLDRGNRTGRWMRRLGFKRASYLERKWQERQK